MRRKLIANHLKQAILFKNSNDSDLDMYSESARVEVLSEGEYVYRQGDPSDVFYVVAVGEADLVVLGTDKTSSVVGRIGAGGHFGETGLLRSEPRSLAVRAHGDLVVICFDKRFFRTAIISNNQIHHRLGAILADRLRVSFQEQANTAGSRKSEENGNVEDDAILFENKSDSMYRLPRVIEKKNKDIRQSRTARKTQEIIDKYSGNSEPYMLVAEQGSCKSSIAKQIHLQSDRKNEPYLEVDLRKVESSQLERELFGAGQGSHPFSRIHQAGIFEKTSGGTLVFTHVDLMCEDLQKHLLQVLTSQVYTHVDSTQQLAFQSRVVFISTHDLQYLKETEKFHQELLDLFTAQTFCLSPLRKHKKDIPRLTSYYLNQYNKEYGKKIHSVSPETLGVLMNYDWPGNLKELSGVLRRAVMLAQSDEIRPEQILLGLPKSEGKWEFNVLRIPWVRKVLTSQIFPRVPQAVVGVFLVVTLVNLFFGSQDPESNIGLTMGWYIGWPLMFFSFFFLARIWCSVCALAVPGIILQNILKPEKKTPAFIKKNSGWIMAALCIVVFWVEIVWNAYENPYLTGCVILVITVGSLLFSGLYSRRAWCRYLCPLGAVNAIFSMPAVVELRSNRHVCLNRCNDHFCFAGDADSPGCPMFRHPYLVDNNRDCIMCARCIKSCNNSSIQLNIRLAPEELWSLGTPRLADSFLIVSLGAIIFTFE